MKQKKGNKTEDSSFARAMIAMWNNHFSPTIYHREDGKDVKLNMVKMFNWNPTNYNSNLKLNINYKDPNTNLVIQSRDGLRLATSIWLNQKPTNKWIVGVHGFNSSRFDVLYLTWHYRDLGYNIITFDFRNHGASENDAVTWGFKEKWDLCAVIEWLIKAYKVSEIGLVGTSMGGFTINYLMLTEPGLIKKAKIMWGISDSGYMSVPELLRRMVSQNSPKFLSNLTKETLTTMMSIYKSEYGVDLTRLNFIDLIQPAKEHFPILYIHNRWDRITNYLDSFRMWKVKNNMETEGKNINEIKIFDGYHHTKALIEFTEEYKELSRAFVIKHQRK
jgi:uncharacterized protein